MKVYVVVRDGYKPEGAFEARKLAQEYISDRLQESEDRGHEITELEFVKITDRPDSETFREVESRKQREAARFGTVFDS